MKHWLTTMLCIVFAASMQIYAITEKPTINSRMQELEIQRKQLSELGLWAFFNVAQSNQWTAPKIHSQCWVDWLPEDQEKLKKLEQGRRDFGLEIVKAVEREALRTLLPTSTVERVNQANRLLDFSSWAGAPDGYGNLAIKRRVEHLACIPIGHLLEIDVLSIDLVEKKELLLDARDAVTSHSFVEFQSVTAPLLVNLMNATYNELNTSFALFHTYEINNPSYPAYIDPINYVTLLPGDPVRNVRSTFTNNSLPLLSYPGEETDANSWKNGPMHPPEEVLTIELLINRHGEIVLLPAGFQTYWLFGILSDALREDENAN